MPLIRVYEAALIGLVLLFGVNFVDSILFCNKCTSTENGESCGNEVKDAGQCKDDGEYNHCMTYQYTFNDSTVTVRDCPDANYNCKTLYADGKNDSLVMCNECNDDLYCNENIDTSNTCSKCNSLDSQDCGDTIGDVGENTCFLDSTVNTNCVVYKYKGDSSTHSTVTVRDCGGKNTCDSLRSGEYKESLEMCDQCSNTNGNNCNQNIPFSKTCVKCNSLEQPGCESGTIDTKEITGTCYLDDTVNTECITYKYKENATTSVTVRDCAPKNTCNSFLNDTYKETLEMCHECSSDKPNCNQNLDDLPTCVECNSLQDADCSLPKVHTSKTGVCYLDSLVNFECITYKYLEKDSSMVSVRGCAPVKNCEALHSDTYKEALLMCDECSDRNNCNEVFDTTKTCIECNSLNNGDCQESSPDLSTTCFLDQTVNTECITYKFNDENNQTVTIKGCAPTNQCTNLLSSSLLMCDACNNSDDNNNCNQEIDTTKTCIECNSEDDPNCGEKIDPSITNATCYLDQTVNSECVTYKYQKDSVTTVVVRGCAPSNSCATLGAKNELLYCYRCSSDEPNCNENIDTSKTCVKCNSDSTDSDCGDTVAEITTTCSLDETINTECITYKYQKDNNAQVTIRDCAPKDYCKTLHNDSMIMCNHCTGNNCNSKIETSKKCVQCNSIDDPECAEDRVDTSTVQGRCYLDDTVNVHCVSYKYLQDRQTYIYRGCGSENFCEHAWSNTTSCASCTDDSLEEKLCNFNTNFDKEKTLCIQCTSEDDEECGKDDMNSSKIKKYCSLVADYSECVAYKYLDVVNAKMQTNRDCAPANHCAVLNAFTNTTVCNEGTSLISNKKIDTSTESSLCVECTDEEGSSCAAEEVDLTRVGLCKITNKDGNGCFANKYLNSTTGKMITERGCESEGYCDLHNSDYTAICSECQGKICNEKINATSERAFCVECNGEEETECVNDEIADLSRVGFCRLNSPDLKCVAYKYLNVTSGNFNTYRGCESENYCAPYNNIETTLLCDGCRTGELCNRNIGNEDTLCVECSGEECAADTITNFTQVNFCRINSSNKRQCVTHRYLDVTSGKINTYRGCELDNYCDNQPTSSQLAMICTKCSSTDSVCNVNIDTSNEQIMCIDCTGEEGTDCANNTINDLTKVQFCKLEDNQQCVTYKYLDDKTNKIHIKRGCETTNYCDEYKNEKNTLICDECHDEICNIITKNEGKFICVQCSSEEGSECDNNTVNLAKVNACIINSTANQQCVSHKYLNVMTGKIDTYRGCETKDYCDRHSSADVGSTALCNECNDSDQCNMNIDTSEQLTLCIECVGEEGSECAAATVDLTKMSFCGISRENAKECISYRYLEGSTSRLRTVRGCETRNCSTLVVDDGKVQQCSECHEDICNNYL